MRGQVELDDGARPGVQLVLEEDYHAVQRRLFVMVRIARATAVMADDPRLVLQ